LLRTVYRAVAIVALNPVTASSLLDQADNEQQNNRAHGCSDNRADGIANLTGPDC
jgi:hypothetical protein